MEQQQPEGMLFYSYVQKDQELYEQLASFLGPLVREERLLEWSEQNIHAGEDVESARKVHLESATLILLLLSADYLASDEMQNEMQEALKRRHKVRVIPILLRPCSWENIQSLTALQLLPKDRKPVTQWNDRDTAFHGIERGIRHALRPLQEPVAPRSEPESERAKNQQTAFSAKKVFHSGLYPLPKRSRFPFVVAGLILLILMIVGFGIYGATGNLPWNVFHRHATIPRLARYGMLSVPALCTGLLV